MTAPATLGTHSDLWARRCELVRQINAAPSADHASLLAVAWEIEQSIARTPPRSVRDVAVMVRLAVEETTSSSLTAEGRGALVAALAALEQMPDIPIR